VRIKITTLGKAAHTGSRSKKGINAIHSMGKVINLLAALDLGEKTERFFEFGSSLNISQINGGTAINIIPDKCEIDLDIRLLPTQKEENIITEIKKKINELGIKYELDILQSEQAFLTDENNSFVKILQNTASEILEKQIPLVASGQGSVGNVISKLNIPIINAFGVESDNVHASNEWINVDTIPEVFEIYKKSLMKFDRD